jgi:hypothetical protein
LRNNFLILLKLCFEYVETRNKKMKEVATNNNFKYFLFGTHDRGVDVIRNLPQELRHKIWIFYAKEELSYSYLIKKNMIEVLDIKFTEELERLPSQKSQDLKNFPTLNAVFNTLPLVESLFMKACEMENYQVMKYFFDKFQKKVFPSSNFNFGVWSKLYHSTSDNGFGLIKWFHEHGFEFKESMHMYGHASYVNRLDMIKWIHENLKMLPPPHFNEVLKPMLSHENKKFNADIFKFMLDTFPIIGSTVDDMLLYGGPLINDNIAAVQLISEFADKNNVTDIPWTAAFGSACLFKSFTCMIWLINNRISQDHIFKRLMAVTYAIEKKEVNLLKWMVQVQLSRRVKISKELVLSVANKDFSQFLMDNFLVE